MKHLILDSPLPLAFIVSFGAGILSFLSPCVLPLVPGYLSAVTGIAAADLEKANWRKVIVPSLLFVSSFSAILTARRKVDSASPRFTSA